VLNCDKFAILTCPLYGYKQLASASVAGVPFVELRSLWEQRLVPRGVFKHFLGGSRFRKVFTQSQANADVLVDAGVPPENISVLPVGIDALDRQLIDPRLAQAEKERRGFGEGAVTLLYFGAARKVRGFHALIRAFERVCAEVDHVRLVMLARGATPEQVAQITDYLRHLDLSDKIEVIGGWLSRQQVWTHIEASDVVALPFIIVPSDVPIAILEAMARGRPVIGSSTDGIPELISGRGLIANPLKIDDLAGAILLLAKDHHLRAHLGARAREFMHSYPEWDDVGKLAVREAGLI
jgi:glycosyltransferase involved in cell wall biosynthesis